MRYCAIRFIALMLAVGSLNQSTVALTRDELPFVGAGISGINYHMSQWIFADAAGIWWKTDDATGQQYWHDKSGSLATQYDFDENNYPLSLPAGDYLKCYPFRHNDEHYPLGEYVLTWEGTGDVELRNNLTLVSSEANRKVYNCTQTSRLGIEIRLLSTDPADRVRNVRMWMPGTEDLGSEFHPLFKERLAPFGVLRFMDPLSTNGNEMVEWSDRRKLTNFFKSGANGMAYERAIDLCNELGKDLWLNAPAKANDAFIDSLATLVRDRLNPGLRCWIEYSNETWNWNFTVQSQYTLSLKDLWGLDSRPAAHGRRSVQIFDIFERVFGGTERLIRIMPGQANNPWQLEQAMAEAASYCSPGPVRVDAVSVAYYFTNKTTCGLIWDERANPDKDTIWADLYRIIDENTRWAENMTIAEQYGLPMVAYEGGDHLNAVSQDDYLSGTQLDELAGYIAEIVRDPKFEHVYRYALNKWRDVGGATPVAFVYCGGWSRYGQWGHLEYQDQPLDSAPSYMALVNWADSLTALRVPRAGAPVHGGTLLEPRSPGGYVCDLAGRIRPAGVPVASRGIRLAPGVFLVPREQRTILRIR